MSAAILGIAATAPAARADTPASQVTTQAVGPSQTYPVVNAHGEGWFDVGGFCKVVDVGDLSWTNPPAKGIPVFIPGSAAQWSNWRSGVTNPSTRYQGQLASTTCCRPQANIATLCATGTNPTPASRQYGKLGETDQVSATCYDSHGLPFTDTVALTCQGDNGPDGQAAWQQTGHSQACSPNAWTSACSASCGGGTQTTYDSCGNVQRISACNTQACCTPNYVTSCGACNANNTKTCTTYDANNCAGSTTTTGPQACSLVVVGYTDCTPFECDNCGDGNRCYTCGNATGCSSPFWPPGITTWDGCTGTCSGIETDYGDPAYGGVIDHVTFSQWQ